MTQYISSRDLTTKLNEDGSIAANTNGPVYTLFDLEKRVVQALNDFNEKYAVYLRCSKDIYNINEVNYNVAYKKKDGCRGLSKNKNVNGTAAKNAYDVLSTRIAALNNGLANLRNNGGITNQEYEERYNAILSKHAEILRIRHDIDEKMKDIAAVDDVNKRPGRPPINDVFIYHDTTVYSSMILTVLATSLIYYAFVKM